MLIGQRSCGDYIMPKQTITVVTGQVWESLTAECTGGRTKYLAISYLGDGAADLLDLRKGDRLVTDLSDDTVRSGATNPREALRILQRGVEIDSVANLHAKTFVCGSTTIVGSANPSNNSAKYLLEAGAIIRTREVATQVREWIESLRGERVGVDTLKRKITLMPKRRPAKRIGRKTSAKPGVPLHAPLWLVSIADADWYPDHEKAVTRRSRALKKERARRGYDVTEWEWRGTFAKRLKPGDQIIQLDEDEPSRVYEPQTVLEVEYKKHEGRPVAYVYLEYRLNERSFTRNAFAKLAKRINVHVAKRPRKLIRDADKAHALRNLFVS